MSSIHATKPLEPVQEEDFIHYASAGIGRSNLVSFSICGLMEWVARCVR